MRQTMTIGRPSFICSSNNHIGRITKMVQALCKHYSPPLLSLPPPSPQKDGLLEHTYHPFPPPSALSAPGVVATLRSLGFGYRAEYIQRTAAMLVEAHGSESACEAAQMWLKSLRDASTEEAREELLKFVGVGRKVADCVLLMSLDKASFHISSRDLLPTPSPLQREVIPVDTHVHQIAIKHYGLRSPTKGKGKAPMTPKLYADVNERLVNVWGEYAGWAHSVSCDPTVCRLCHILIWFYRSCLLRI
jgi:N-glycosylase/DNA lyase